MKSLLIIGAGGHAKVVADAALQAGWTELRFADARYPESKLVRQWPLVASDQDVLCAEPSSFGVDGVIVAIGNARVRSELLSALKARGWPVATVVHPSAVVSPFAKVGAGTVVLARAVVNIDAQIGEGTIINTGAVVEHDCVLGVCVHVSPLAALAGGVTVGDYSWVGVGAAVRQGTTIGANVMVGAGAAVVSAIADGATVVGVPAKPLRR